MRTWKTAGSALAVGLLITACGADKGPDTNKITSSNTPVTNPTPSATTTRNVVIGAPLADLLRSVDRGFEASRNCVELLGVTTLNVYQGACAAKSEPQGQKGKGKQLAFSLVVEPVKETVGQKGTVTPPAPKPGKQEQVGAPAPKYFMLILKGHSKGSGKQAQTIPDTRVGLIAIEQLVVEPLGKPAPTGKQEQTGKQEPPKPGPVGKQEPTGGKEQTGKQEPKQGKPEPVGQKPMAFREEVRLLDLCTGEFRPNCDLTFTEGAISGIRSLLAATVSSSEPQKGKQEQVGKQEPKPKQEQVGKQEPKPKQEQVGKPAPKQEQKKPEVVGKAPEQKQVKPEPLGKQEPKPTKPEQKPGKEEPKPIRS